MADISERIRILRTSAKLTQEEFGNIFGIVKSTVSLYESGKSCPNDQIKIKICQYFDVSLDYLLGQDSVTSQKAPENFTQHEISIVKKYRRLNDHGKSLIDTLLEHEYQSATGEQVNNVS